MIFDAVSYLTRAALSIRICRSYITSKGAERRTRGEATSKTYEVLEQWQDNVDEDWELKQCIHIRVDKILFRACGFFLGTNPKCLSAGPLHSGMISHSRDLFAFQGLLQYKSSFLNHS